MVKFYLIFFVVFLLYICFAEGSSNFVFIDYFPKGAFFGDEISVKITCPESFTLDKIILTRRDNSQRIYQNPSDQIILTSEDYVLSSFNLTAICSKENLTISNTITFNLNILNFSIVRILNNYTNEEISIVLVIDLIVNGNRVNLSPENFTLTFSFTNNFKLERIGNNFFINFSSSRPINSIENISIYLKEFSRTFSRSFRLIISNPLSSNIILDENKVFFPEETIKVPIEVFYKGTRLSSSSVSISVFNARLNKIFDCENYICLDITLPKETTFININVRYGNHLLEIRRQVNIGKIGYVNFVDYDNKPISIILRVDNFQYSLSGNQTFLFLPGIKNITLKYRNAEIYMFNVNLSEFDDSIRFYSLEVNERNLRILDFFVFETNLQYEKILTRIYYDEKRVDYESRISAIFCEEFSLKDKACKNWKTKSFTQNNISNFIEFEISSIRYFGIYEKSELRLSYSLNKQKFYFDDRIFISGIVVDNFGRFQNVELKVNFLDKNYNIRTQNGRFELSLISPRNEGEYYITIFSEDVLFINFREKIKITVEPKVEISLLTQSIKISNKDDISFIEIKNTGQKDLENLIILTENCKADREKIDKFYVSETIKIKLFNFSALSNPQIIKLIIKNSDEEFVFQIPVYFEVFKNQTNVRNFPTGQFVLVFDNSTYISLAISFFIILFAVVVSRKKSEGQKLYGKSFLKRKFS